MYVVDPSPYASQKTEIYSNHFSSPITMNETFFLFLICTSHTCHNTKQIVYVIPFAQVGNNSWIAHPKQSYSLVCETLTGSSSLSDYNLFHFLNIYHSGTIVIARTVSLFCKLIYSSIHSSQLQIYCIV